ncbi:MAG: hypothetical protein QM817_21695 [Archangium sp.]
MSAIEKQLAANSAIAANAGHSIHKGTPREAFIADFLESHLSNRVAIGTGEVIDAKSQAGAQRHQHDIVIYRPEYPRLSFGGGISAFLIESVVATIEVKSTLTRAELENATRAAGYLKNLTPSRGGGFSSGYIPPKVLTYIVAYDGPKQMSTVHSWIAPIHSALGIQSPPALPPTLDERVAIPSTSFDGVFVLGRGLLTYDNAPLSFISNAMRSQTPAGKWSVVEASDVALLTLFMTLTQAVAGVLSLALDPLPYLSNVRVSTPSLLP